MTELGMTLLPIIEMMYEWGKKRIENLKVNGLEQNLS
jgi:DNA-binding HxlR family transcriptional regulator